MKNTTETVTAKEAAFMLDTDMAQDMQSYGKELTTIVIKQINRSAELYKDVKFGRITDKEYTPKTVKATCVAWAKAHNDEFGGVFITELDDVNWNEVLRRV